MTNNLKPSFNTEAKKISRIENEIVELKSLQKTILAEEVPAYYDYKKALNKSARVIEAAAAGLADQELADTARALIFATRTMLEDWCRRVEEKATFENTGLPIDPTLKRVYALLRDDEKEHNPLSRAGSELGVTAALILYKTGAATNRDMSTNIDMLGATMLNQYTLLNVSRKKLDKLLDLTTLFNGDTSDWDAVRATSLATLRREFSPQLVELYLATAPSGYSVAEKAKLPVTDEMKLISAAVKLYYLESLHARYLAQKKKGGAEFRSYAGPLQLEMIESFANTLKQQAQTISSEGLRERIKKSVAKSNRMMKSQSNAALRKPGSAPINPGW